MSVVEHDAWRYPLGDDADVDMDGARLPNPYDLVGAPPWGGWCMPEVLERLGGGLPPLSSGEADRLGWWLFLLGTSLWQVQQGEQEPEGIRALMPEPRWLPWLLRWVLESARSPRPPWYRPSERTAWRRRAQAVDCLRHALVGLYWGLQVQAATEALEELELAPEPELDTEVIWQ
jgi:hypothetical protein